MANRVIRDWTDSTKVDLLSFQAEVLFMRLMMKADDYGSFHANTKLVKAALFPLKMDTIREADISRWMDELQKAGLIVFYEVEQKPYLRILKFGQRMRNMKKRFPDMPADNLRQSADNLRQSAASCDNSPSEEKRKEIEIETENEVEKGSESVSPPSPLVPPESFLEGIKHMDLQSCAKAYFRTKRYERAVELLCMGQGLTVNGLKNLALQFNEHCTFQGKISRTLDEWASHFSYWVKDPKRLESQQKSVPDETAEWKRKLQAHKAKLAGG